MNKIKLFLNNFLVYGLGGIISKIIPLIMVPIVTRLMPNTEYYGISDMSNTIVSLCSALAIMGMYDAMYRMFFDKEDDLNYKKDVCSTALWFTVCTSVIVFVIMLILKDFIAEKFFGDTQYAYLVYISAMATLIGATNSIVSAPTRMQNKRGIYLITNTISPIISYAIAIPLLLKGYYVIALPLSGLISAVTLEICFAILNHKWFSIKRFKFSYLKPLLLIAFPLLPNFIIYWIFNSCDKLMITNILGVGATGIYSVASKLGNVSQLIYTAFAGGWQFFAFSVMKEKGQVKTNSIIFEYLGIISFACSVAVFALSESIFKLFFTEEYFIGYISAPYLFLAPLLQMLFQVAANQFLVIKKTWPNLLILSTGAIVNVILNLVLIPILGIEGASIATLAGYAISDVICVTVLCCMKQMVISKRFILSCIVLIAYIVLWRFIIKSIVWLSCICALCCIVIFVLLYLKDIKALVLSIRESLKNKKVEKDISDET
jgi:O-antigen/teichoic acid export membrane protein